MRIALPIPISTSLRILLAEDNQINQRIVLALLEKHGHTVDIASNGVVAVEAVLRADYDIVLMDIQMPELDGVAATKQIRALAEPKCSIPIVAMTANAMSGARAEYLAAGMDAYISKPYEFETLMAIIDRLTAGRTPAGFGESIEPSSAKVTAKAACEGGSPTLPVLDTTQQDWIYNVLSQDQVRGLQSLYLKNAESHIPCANRN